MRSLLRLAARLAAAALALAVLVLSLVPDPEDYGVDTDIFSHIAALVFGDPSLGDKVSHFTAYGVLAAATVAGFVRSWTRAVIVFGLLVLFGAALEVLQGLGGVRMRDGLDLLANVVGILAGMAAGGLAVFVFKWWLPPERTTPRP